jgi:hypothetical protein
LIACIVIAVVAAALAMAVELPDIKMLLDGRLRIPDFGTHAPYLRLRQHLPHHLQ